LYLYFNQNPSRVVGLLKAQGGGGEEQAVVLALSVVIGGHLPMILKETAKHRKAFPGPECFLEKKTTSNLVLLFEKHIQLNIMLVKN
jgi:hypothetical protein